MFLPLILVISLLACATTAAKRPLLEKLLSQKHFGRIPQHTQSGDSSHLYNPLEVLSLPRVQSQDDNELYSDLVESVVNVRQLEGEFVDSVHIDKSEGVQGRIAKSKMWWFENLNMSLRIYIEVLSNGW